jgi:hypothetical protein
MNEKMTASVSSWTVGPRPLARLVLAAGPAAMVLLLDANSAWFAVPSMQHLTIFALVWFWSPVFVGVPAFVLQPARDAYLPGARGIHRLRRACTLVPDLARANSPVRVEMWCSLVGFTAAVVLAWPHITAALELLGLTR